MESEQTFDCCFEQESNIEESIMQNGVSFVVNYIGELPNDAIPQANNMMMKIFQGCIEIITSMKLLDFQSRSLVAKECINRVCDAASLKSPKKRRVEKRIQSCIADEHCLEHSGASVGMYMKTTSYIWKVSSPALFAVLNISSRCLELTSVETGEIVARHEMPNISFASGGDSEASNFVAYVGE